MAGPRETFDVSETQRKCMLARAARREKLRHEYLEQTGNPYRMAAGESGHPFDKGLQRFHVMHGTRIQYFRPTVKNGLTYIATVILPIAVTMYFFCKDKEKQERIYRSGAVSYRDREFKFF